jgi:hypothetical protein
MGGQVYPAELSKIFDALANTCCGNLPVLITDKYLLTGNIGAYFQPIVQIILSLWRDVHGSFP